MFFAQSQLVQTNSINSQCFLLRYAMINLSMDFFLMTLSWTSRSWIFASKVMEK